MERIILSNNFQQIEFLRTLAKQGKKIWGLRVLSDVELLFYVLEKLGQMPDGKYITSKDETYIYYTSNNGDFTDAQNVCSAIDTFRDCVTGDISKLLNDTLNDDFSKKKELIQKQYKALYEYKKKNNLFDKYDIMTLLLKVNEKIDAECIYYKEYGISKVLLEVIQNVFTKVTERSIRDDFSPVHKEENNSIHFLRAYGTPCELDYVFSEIQKHPVDECQIVVVNPKLAIEVARTAETLGVPYTSYLGKPVISTNAGIMLSYLLELDKALYGVDGYRSLFGCSVFDKTKIITKVTKKVNHTERDFEEFIQNVGHLRLDFQKNPSQIKNNYKKLEMYQTLLYFEECLSKGYGEFIREFLTTIEPADESVIQSIINIENDSESYGFKLIDVLKNYLSSSINKRVSKEGHLYIANYQSAISSLRKYNFVIGLDSSFPGNPKENYLIYDDEYLKTGSSIYLSKEIVQQKERIISAFIDACEDITLSYSYFDLGELVDQNPSSVIFDRYSGSDISNIKGYTFDDIQLSHNKNVYKAAIQNLLSSYTKNVSTLQYDKDLLLRKTYYPSQIVNFFKKERYIQFILQVLFGIDVKGEDDPFEIINAREYGTLVHEVMENFDKSKTSEKELLQKAEKELDKFFEMKPPIVKVSLPDIRKEYLETISSLYNNDPGNTPISCENKALGDIKGIKFSGPFDRLEQDKNGDYILVDYKTGKTLEHKNNDPESCVQGLIYAYLIEHYGSAFNLQSIKIKRIEYRYPRLNETIHIDYNQTYEMMLIDLIDKFKNAIETGDIFTGYDHEEQTGLDDFAHLFSIMNGVPK